MKTKLTLSLLFLAFTLSQAQVDGRKQLTEGEAEQLGNIKTKGIKFGISMGFNQTFDDLYDARISPIDTTLILQKTSNTSFMLSSSLSFPILTQKLGGGSYYRSLDANGNPVGDPYFIPSGLNVVVTINLVTFNSALGGSGVFNQKLDGGLGLSYAFGEKVQLAATYEMISFRQPRDFLKDYDNKQIKFGDDASLTNLSLDDNDYFIDKYIPSISLKVIYLLN